jgi:uncharacterized protein (DUF58 family)
VLNEALVARSCETYRLNRDPRAARGRAGAHLGAQAGTSVDFFDYRKYVPGDDLRHVDWAVYARTRERTLRLYHAEVVPAVDVLLDCSRSMAIHDGRKAELSLELGAFAVRGARAEGSKTRLHAVGERCTLHEEPRDVRFDAPTTLLLHDSRECARRVPPGGLRVVISDFLGPTAPETVVRSLSVGASELFVIAVLGPWEASPTADGLSTLHDAERTLSRSLQLDATAIQRYRERLGRIRTSLRDACARLGARLAEVIADDSLEQVLRRDLLPASIVRPA